MDHEYTNKHTYSLWPYVIGFFSMALLILIAAFSFSGNTDPHEPSYPPYSILREKGLRLLWKKSNIAPSSNDNVVLIAKNKRVFIGTVNNPNTFNVKTKIIVLDSLDGNILGDIGIPQYSDTFTTDGSTVFYSYGGTLFEYNFEEQKQVWEKAIPPRGKPIHIHQLVDGELQFTGYHPILFRLNLADKTLIEESYEELGFGPFRYENGIYYDYSGWRMHAIDKNGKTIWKTAEIGADYDRLPTFTSKAIFVLHFGTLHAINRQTGKTAWRTGTNIFSNIAVGKERIYFLTEDMRLYGIRIKNAHVIASVTFSQNDIEDIEKWNTAYQVAYDEELGIVFVLFGDSEELFAFKEID